MDIYCRKTIITGGLSWAKRRRTITGLASTVCIIKIDTFH